MPIVGDRVHVASVKLGQLPRDGVVTGVSGSLLRVKWSTGEESTVVPGVGTLAVIGKAKKTSTKASKKKAAAAKKVTKKKAAAAKKVTKKKAAAAKKVTKKSVSASKKRATAAKKVNRSSKTPSKTKKTAKRRA